VETIEGGKVFKGGNYSQTYGMLMIIDFAIDFKN
jgi:hypothetical protein